MTFQEFETLQRQMFADIEKIGAGKGREYASSDDRLANFKRLALELAIPAEKIGYIYFKKHLDSICTYLKDGKEHSEEGIRGRFLDAINYLILIYGLIVESKKNTPEYIAPGSELYPITMTLPEKITDIRNKPHGPDIDYLLDKFLRENGIWKSLNETPKKETTPPEDPLDNSRSFYKK